MTYLNMEVLKLIKKCFNNAIEKRARIILKVFFKI